MSKKDLIQEIKQKIDKIEQTKASTFSSEESIAQNNIAISNLYIALAKIIITMP